MVRWETEAAPKTVSMATVQRGDDLMRYGDQQINRTVRRPRSWNWQSHSYVTTARFGGMRRGHGLLACASGNLAGGGLRVTTSVTLPSPTCLPTEAGRRKPRETVDGGQEGTELSEVAGQGCKCKIVISHPFNSTAEILYGIRSSVGYRTRQVPGPRLIRRSPVETNE